MDVKIVNTDIKLRQGLAHFSDNVLRREVSCTKTPFFGLARTSLFCSDKDAAMRFWSYDLGIAVQS